MDKEGNYDTTKGGLFLKVGDSLVAATVKDVESLVNSDNPYDFGALTLKLHVGADATENNQISVDLGICSSLIGAMSTGNFASGQSNLEMITAQLYTWVYEWQNELNFVINKNIIQDLKNPVEVYYFPTSFVNRQGFFDQMLKLYTTAGGSLRFLIASAGIDAEAYLSVLDEEIDDGLFEKYLPHQTSFTMSSDSTNEGGRPKTNNPSENTLKSQANNGNALPSPSDNK